MIQGEAGRKPAPHSFAQSLKAVGWSFFGVRKQRDLEHDAARIRPLHLILAALLMAALFIGGLLLIVDWVVERATVPSRPAVSR